MARFDKLEFDKQQPTPKVAPAPLAQSEGRDFVKLADAQRRIGQYENALRLFSRALEDDKSLVGGWLGQVQMLMHLNEYPEAELWSRKALELFPNHGDLLAGRAHALCRQGDAGQALAVCDGALRQPGSSSYRWLVRGEIMVAQRQDVDLHCFDKAQQIDPDWLVPLEAALAYLHQGQSAKAATRARLAVEKAPDAYYAWYVLGLAQFRSHLQRAARESFKRCLELCPRHVDSQQRLAEMDAGGWSPARLWNRLWASS